MKRFKKIMSVLLTAIMVLAMCIPVLANTVTVTTPSNLPNHTYVAYQIFTGTQGENKGALGEAAWGTGINETTFLQALKDDSELGSFFAKCSNAKAVVAALSTNVTSNTNRAKKVAKLAYANKKGQGIQLVEGDSELEAGYYLIVDTTDVAGKPDVANTALLQVTNNINIENKTDKPSVEKKVKENVKVPEGDSTYGTKYNDVADYNIGDAVPFHLIGTVPDMSNYDTYKYVFHDTLSEGLTANVDTNDTNNQKVIARIYLSSDKIVDANDQDITTNFTTSGISGNTTTSFTVSCDDLKAIENITAGKYIIVEYSAILNSKAVIGLDGNENEVYLEYSNKPDQSGSGDNNTGKTPEDKVIVFTYQLNTTKVDGQVKTKKLENAEFKLKNAAGKWALVTGGKVSGWADVEQDGTTLKSDGNGLFTVAGLDDGVYYLKETKAPAGYNVLPNNVELTIQATTANNQKWNNFTPSDALTRLQITANNTTNDGDKNSGIVNLQVENNKGSQLPETGGIGTTIFYVVGVVLMLGAGVLLITKRRMSAKH